MTPRLLPWTLLGLGLLACSKSGTARDPGRDAADIASDTRVLQDAQGAVNDLIRAGGDCEAIRAAKGPALAKLDEATGKVRTAAGRQTLEALRKQAGNTISSCE